jgi:DNA gyrase subunit A
MAIRFDENHVRPMGRAAYGVNGINREERDYVVGMTVTPRPGAPGAEVGTTDHVETATGLVGTDASVRPAGEASKSEPTADTEIPTTETIDLTQKGTLILSVTENGYGKRTPADEYRLTNRAGKGVINIKTTERVGKVVAIALVDENSQVMLISQYGKIIRMDSKTIRESGRNAQGVRLLHMEPGDRVAAAVVLAPEEEPNGNGGLLQ